MSGILNKIKWIFVILIIIVIIIIGSMMIYIDYNLMQYKQQYLDPYLRYTNVGEVVKTDDFTFSLTGITARDSLEYNCPEANSTGGWEFLVMNYYINNTGNYTLTIEPVLIRDKNNVAYLDLGSVDERCQPDELHYPKKIPPKSLKGGNLIYKIPTNVVPDYLNIMVGSIHIIVQGFQKT